MARPDGDGKADASADSARERWRTRAAVGAAVLAVFAGAGAIGAEVRHNKQTEVKPPAGASGPGKLAVPGEAPKVPVTLTLYQDLRSPASRAFAREYGRTLDRMVATGQVRLLHRLVTATDEDLGGTGSARAANAAACAQDAGRFAEYVDVLWRNQPAQDDDAFADVGRLIELSGQAGGLDAAVFEPCVAGGRHDGWVAASQRAFADAGLGGVPVLTINDEVVRPSADALTPEKLRTRVHAAVREAGGGW